MRTTIVDHPLATLLLSHVRGKATGRSSFAAAVDGLGGMLLFGSW